MTETGTNPILAPKVINGPDDYAAAQGIEAANYTSTDIDRSVLAALLAFNGCDRFVVFSHDRSVIIRPIYSRHDQRYKYHLQWSFLKTSSFGNDNCLAMQICQEGLGSSDAKVFLNREQYDQYMEKLAAEHQATKEKPMDKTEPQDTLSPFRITNLDAYAAALGKEGFTEEEFKELDISAIDDFRGAPRYIVFPDGSEVIAAPVYSKKNKSHILRLVKWEFISSSLDADEHLALLICHIGVHDSGAKVFVDGDEYVAYIQKRLRDNMQKWRQEKEAEEAQQSTSEEKPVSAIERRFNEARESQDMTDYYRLRVLAPRKIHAKHQFKYWREIFDDWVSFMSRIDTPTTYIGDERFIVMPNHDIVVAEPVYDQVDDRDGISFNLSHWRITEWSRSEDANRKALEICNQGVMDSKAKVFTTREAAMRSLPSADVQSEEVAKSDIFPSRVKHDDEKPLRDFVESMYKFKAIIEQIKEDATKLASSLSVPAEVLADTKPREIWNLTDPLSRAEQDERLRKSFQAFSDSAEAVRRMQQTEDAAEYMGDSKSLDPKSLHTVTVKAGHAGVEATFHYEQVSPKVLVQLRRLVAELRLEDWHVVVLYADTERLHTSIVFDRLPTAEERDKAFCQISAAIRRFIANAEENQPTG